MAAKQGNIYMYCITIMHSIIPYFHTVYGQPILRGLHSTIVISNKVYLWGCLEYTIAQRRES